MFGVGDIVRRLRLAHGWTIETLAHHAGVNKMTVSAIERGANFTRAKLDSVARALGLENGSALDTRLQEWAAQHAQPRTLTDPAFREWVEMYDVLRLDPASFDDQRRMLRHWVEMIRKQRKLPASPASSAPAAAPPPGTGRKKPARSRR